METREFDDALAARKNIFDGVLKATAERYPLENTRFRLELGDVGYPDPREFTLKEQKNALLGRNSLYWKLNGTWRMVDKATGKIIDKRATTLAHVPWMTQRGTFIHNGNEYIVNSQMRLKPGVYARQKENGEFEAHFNIMPGSGKSFRINMEPETGVFKMQIGQANIPLYPLLRSLGVTDQQLEKTWGKDLLHANRSKEEPQAIRKIYQRLVGGRAAEDGQQLDEITKAFTRMRLDPESVKQSLGKFLA